MNIKAGKYCFKNGIAKLNNNLYLKRLKNKIGLYKKELNSNTLELVKYLYKGQEIYFLQDTDCLYYFYFDHNTIDIIKQENLFWKD